MARSVSQMWTEHLYLCCMCYLVWSFPFPFRILGRLHFSESYAIKYIHGSEFSPWNGSGNDSWHTVISQENFLCEILPAFYPSASLRSQMIQRRAEPQDLEYLSCYYGDNCQNQEHHLRLLCEFALFI